MSNKQKYSKGLKEEIIKICLNFIKKKRIAPTYTDLIKMDITKDQIKSQFGNLTNLHNLIALEYPMLLKDYSRDTQNTSKLKSEIKKYNTFVVTTLVIGTQIDEKFHKNLEFYCQQNNAKLLYLLTANTFKPDNKFIDNLVDLKDIVFESIDLNDNIQLSTFKMNAKQINPLNGMKRLGKREKSIVLASPKQFLEYVPIANDKSCHAIMTTGTICKPEYGSSSNSPKGVWIASMDHKLGAVVIEIQNKKEFHVRQIQAEIDTGYFIDLCKYYKLNRIEDIRPEAMVLGDKHVGATNSMVEHITDEMINELNPKRIFFHDLFDGQSVNPHSMKQHLLRANQPFGLLSLEAELKMCADEVKRMVEIHPEVQEWLIVRSNHDEFLDRYLESGDYIQDPHNSRIGHLLALEKLKDKIPLESALRRYGVRSKRVKFLNIHSSYKIAGIEHGVHGHLGLNGQKNPQNSSLEIGYGAGVFGHSHSPGILREVYRVGTSTNLRLGYNKGSSSWVWTHCLTYSNGSRQLINIINGRYKQKSKK